MSHRVVLQIFDHDKLDEIPLEPGKWRHAFLRLTDGKVILAEIFNTSEGRMYGIAGTDCVDRASYDERVRIEPDYYDEDMTFENHMAWAFKGCFKIEEVQDV